MCTAKVDRKQDCCVANLSLPLFPNVFDLDLFPTLLFVPDFDSSSRNMDEDLRAEVATLRRRVADLEAAAASAGTLRDTSSAPGAQTTATDATTARYGDGGLTRAEVERYSRQIMLPSVGSAGTRRLLDGSVLIVGAGGLGSTCAMYVATGGVGRIGIVDFDAVELSNLHRQVIHPTHRVTVPKCVSARATCLALNPTANVEAIEARFDATNGVDLCRRFDVVIDCSDNVAARYLINDAAVLAGRPLVAGSAMRWEGQLTVYNCAVPAPATTSASTTAAEPPSRGPCYRCVFPSPPPLAALGSCNESGVMGPCPGAIGCLQAAEAMKLLLQRPDGCLVGRMLFVDFLRGTFRTVKLRPRDAKCVACGTPEPPATKLSTLESVGDAYAGLLCAAAGPTATSLAPANRCGAAEFTERALPAAAGTLSGSSAPDTAAPAPVLLDVREPTQFAMCAVDGSVNVPLADLKRADSAGRLDEFLSDKLPPVAGDGSSHTDVLVLCRRGVDSVTATQLLVQHQAARRAGDKRGRDEEAPASGTAVRPPRTEEEGPRLRFRNVDGGLSAATRHGADFPAY